jgi:hypothetical protein
MNLAKLRQLQTPQCIIIHVYSLQSHRMQSSQSTLALSLWPVVKHVTGCNRTSPAFCAPISIPGLDTIWRSLQPLCEEHRMSYRSIVCRGTKAPIRERLALQGRHGFDLGPGQESRGGEGTGWLLVQRGMWRRHWELEVVN